jgi:tetratricopeptide (TPR) repeat protein
LGVLGKVYINLGALDRGIELHRRATAIRRDSIDGQEGLADALGVLASAHSVARQFGPARAALAEAVEVAAAAHDTLSLAYGRLGLGRALLMLEMPDSAEVQLRVGLALLDNVTAEDHQAYLQPMGDLAGILRRRGDLAGADSLYTVAVTRRRALPNGDPLTFTVALNDLAIVRRMRGDLESAEELYREGLDSLDAALGPGHPRIQLFRANLVTTLTQAEKWEEAIVESERYLEGYRNAWPGGHWRIGTGLTQLGGAYIKADRASQAVEPLQEALAVMTQQLGANNAWTDVTRGWLATALALTGQAQAADELIGYSIMGLSTYEGLPQDATVKGMLGHLVDTMREKGLAEYANRLGAIAEQGGAP